MPPTVRTRGSQTASRHAPRWRDASRDRRWRRPPRLLGFTEEMIARQRSGAGQGGEEATRPSRSPTGPSRARMTTGKVKIEGDKSVRPGRAPRARCSAAAPVHGPGRSLDGAGRHRRAVAERRRDRRHRRRGPRQRHEDEGPRGGVRPRWPGPDRARVRHPGRRRRPLDTTSWRTTSSSRRADPPRTRRTSRRRRSFEDAVKAYRSAAAKPDRPAEPQARPVEVPEPATGVRRRLGERRCMPRVATHGEVRSSRWP